MNLPAGTRIAKALVDTSAYFALFNKRDQDHAGARAILSALATQKARLFTTNFVVAETHALLLTRVGYQAARQFLEEAEQSTITIVRATTRDEERARAIIYQYQDKDFSLTDAISFAVMERLDIRYAFTFDRHFAQYGLPVLTPE